MENTSSLYRDFLSELGSWERFAEQHLDRYGDASPEDPDVRRLIEAMGFFSARTKACALEGTNAALVRQVEEVLPALVRPVPSQALIRARPHGLVNPVELVAGTALRLESPSGAAFRFEVLAPVSLLPLSVSSCRLDYQFQRGFVLTMQLESLVPLPAREHPLPLFIHRGKDYLAALTFQQELRLHLRRVIASYDEPPDRLPAESKKPCPERGAVSEHHEPFEGPLERTARLIRYPEQELFLPLVLPAAEAPWKRVWLEFELGTEWPEELFVSDETLLPFVFPVLNLFKAYADPIVHDGSRSAYPLELRGVGRHTHPHSVAGVYRVADDSLSPLRPSVLPTRGDCYQVERLLDDGMHQLSILLDVPGALTEPISATVLARWFQPEFDRRTPGPLRVTLQQRSVDGLRLDVLGDPAQHRVARRLRDPLTLLNVLSLRSKPHLEWPELCSLLEWLGVDEGSRFEPLLRRITNVVAREEAQPDVVPLVRLVYRVFLERLEPEEEPLMVVLLGHLKEVMTAWSRAPVQLELAGDHLRLAKRLERAGVT